MESDQERLDRLSSRAAIHAGNLQRGLNEKVSGIRKKIEDLLDERGGVERAPRTVKETLEFSKKVLAERRKKHFMEEILVSELKNVQNQRSTFFEPSSLRVHSLSDLNLFRWAFSWITEKDIEEAASALDSSIGIDEKERAKRILEINEKVKKLEGEIEKLMA